MSVISLKVRRIFLSMFGLCVVVVAAYAFAVNGKKDRQGVSLIAREEAEKVVRHTKIVATVGPASNSREIIRELIASGVDVFRLNFSHGTHESHKAVADIIRQEARAARKHVALLVDLQGPKLRIGTFKDGKINLRAGTEIAFDLNPMPGDESRVFLPHKEVYGLVSPDTVFYLDDGKLFLNVIAASEKAIRLKVVKGGELSNKKGVGIRGIRQPGSVLTEKDLNDLKFALTFDPEWIALSFVQDAEDVLLLRSKLAGKDIGIVSKIETSGALKAIDDIVKVSDAVMVARGDLSVDISPENLFDAQNVILKSARTLGKPVVMATQMMESMIVSSKPTNAEVTDVGYAVSNFADAVMLSGETAAGNNPVLTVQTMDAIIKRVESDKAYTDKIKSDLFDTHVAADDRAFPRSLAQFATTNGMKYIAVKETDGVTIDLIKHIAAARPLSFVVVCEEPNDRRLNALQLVWGVYALACMPEMLSRECTAISHLIGSQEVSFLGADSSNALQVRYAVRRL